MTTEQLDLTVVLTTHNRADLVGDMLASLAEQNWDGEWDVLVVDNDSTDDTYALVEAWLPRMPVPARLVRANERRDRSYARNTAVDATTANNVAFIDDDDVLGEGWLSAIGNALEDHEFVASRSDYDRLNSPQLAATCSFQRERLGRHFGVEIVDAAGSAMRREHWVAVGGCDEAARNIEDTDLALRMHQHGIRAHFCADAEYSTRLRSGFGPAFRRGLGRGRGELLLYNAHRDVYGLRSESPVIAAGRWIRLVIQAPSLFSPVRRVVWAENAGRRIGRAQACLTERTWYP